VLWIVGSRKVHIDEVAIDAEAALPHLGAQRHKGIDMLNNLTKPDVHMRIDSLQADRARKTSQPTGRSQIEVPLVVRGGWRRRECFLRSVVRFRSGEKNWRGKEDGCDYEAINDSAD